MNYTTNTESVAVERPKVEEPINKLMFKLRDVLRENFDAVQHILIRLSGDTLPIETSATPDNMTDAVKELLDVAVCTNDILQRIRSHIG